MARELCNNMAQTSMKYTHRSGLCMASRIDQEDVIKVDNLWFTARITSNPRRLTGPH